MRRLLLLPLLSLAALAAHADEETRTLPAFTSISNSGPISIAVDVGKAQSVVASGNQEFLAQLKTEVVDGELRVSMKNHRINGSLGDPKLIVTLPALSRFAMAGAGAATLTHVSGDTLSVEYSGAGSLKADGKVTSLKLEIAGVGSIDTRRLVAEKVSVNVGGVGNVQVYASDTLDADVSGVGSLTYYGNPRTVHKSAGGIGSVSKGD
jgi:hypothetical protein